MDDDERSRNVRRQNSAAYGMYVTPEERRASFIGRWPYKEQTDKTEEMIMCGFFFTGTDDLIRCHHCGIGLKDWSESADPLVEHVRYSPDCQFLKDTIPPTKLARIKVSFISNYVESSQESLAHVRASQSANVVQARNPQYILTSVRIASFVKWPRRITQTPEELAEAGFFYTGANDIVRCYVCDGGLQNWSPEDSAWVEHARWFPHCAHVRQMKGEDFIEIVRLSAEHEQLEEVEASRDAVAEQLENMFDFIDISRKKEAAQRYPRQTNSNAEIKRKVCEVTLCTEETAENAIATLINKNLPVTKVSVIDFVMKMTNTKKSDNTTLTTNSPKEPETMEELLDENEKLRMEIKCLLCEDNDANCLFLPCAHYCLCVECSADVTMCPMCLKNVNNKVKIYIS